ncbi:MAG: hypothetical protein AAF138_02405, partial [Planctomycetota bacterium]
MSMTRVQSPVFDRLRTAGVGLLIGLATFTTCTYAHGGLAETERALAPDTPPTLSQWAQQEAATLEAFLFSGDLRPKDTPLAREEADELLRTLAAFGHPTRDADAFRDAAMVRRLAHLIEAAGPADAVATADLLAERPDLRSSLALLLDLEADDLPGVARVLRRLEAEHARWLDRYADLSAALAVVHDQPARRRINENSVDQTDPVELFAYYRRHESRLSLSVRRTAPEMLVYVVDVAAPIRDLEWALNRHGGQAHVGKLYHNINYDTAHYRHGKPKKVTEAGFNLPNVARYGGVCADQSYYAETVGHALGVPAITVHAVGSEAAHCWIGYIRPQGRGAVWDFSEGRWNAYDDLRGSTRHPQTRRVVSDAQIALSARAATLPRAERERAAALADAARLLTRSRRAQSRNAAWPPDAPEGVRPAPRARDADANASLELLQASLQRSPASAAVWTSVAETLSKAQLNARERRSWAEAIDRAAGRDHADVALEVLTPLINSEPKPAARSKRWDWMFTRVRQRPDLAAEVRLRQGLMWQTAGDKHRAWLSFHNVIDNYAQDGPMVVTAADTCARMLLADDRAG